MAMLITTVVSIIFHTLSSFVSETKKALCKFFLVAAVILATPAVVHAGTLPVIVDGQKLPTLANVVSKVEASIVSISSRVSQSTQMNDILSQDDFFRDFFKFGNPGQRQNREYLGSGVIVDAGQGYIVTNAHLIKSKNAEIEVTLSDKRSFKADIMGIDKDMDIALLQLNSPPDDLIDATFGDSDELRVGDFVLAMGSPYDLSATVTSGIVSALGRRNLGIGPFEDFIQTDAAINIGSSGGALVNLRGEVIGINTAILSPGRTGNIGIGFAIPVNAVSKVLRQLQQHGQVRRGILGVHFQELTEELAEAFELNSTKGVLITSVLENSGADRAGLKVGDVLTHINGVEVVDGAHLQNKIALIRVGDTIEVQFIRDGRLVASIARIGLHQSQTMSAGILDPRLEGAEIQEILKGEANDSSILVASVKEGSAAWRFGLRGDDILVKMNKRPVKSMEDVRDALTQGNGFLLVELKRSNGSVFLVMN